MTIGGSGVSSALFERDAKPACALDLHAVSNGDAWLETVRDSIRKVAMAFGHSSLLGQDYLGFAA